MDYISTGEAARRLSVCRKTIYRRIADGSLPAVRLSEKDLRIKEDDLEKFMQARERK